MSSGGTTWSHSTVRPTSTSTQPSSASASSSTMPPSSTAPSLQPTTRGIDLGGWSVRVTSGPIGSSAEMDALGELLGIPPPEMAFPHNSLVLQHADSGFSLCFDAVRALRSIEGVLPENRLQGMDCRDTPSMGKSSVPGAKPNSKSIKVAYAKEWGKSRSDFVATPGEGGATSHFGSSTADITAAKEYDWTYSSTWPGSLGDTAPQPLLSTSTTPSIPPSLRPLSPPSSSDWWEPGTDPARDRIPVERLGPSSGEPILFYDDVVLYEDELADNGSSMVSVKVRVMPSGFLVLQRFFLRVDDVVFRVFDTRLYCSFEPSPVARPLKGQSLGATALPTSLAQLDLGATLSARPKDGDSTPPQDQENTFTPRLIRECSGMSASYALVRSHLPPYKPHDLSPLTDVNWVYSTLTKISHAQQSAYHSRVASGAQLPAVGRTEAAKYVSPYARRPDERMDLSPARAPGARGEAQIVGQVDDDDAWQGSGAVIHVAVLKRR